MTTSRTVLYVEDDSNDVLFMRRAWTQAGVREQMQTVSDGEEAIRYLSGDGPYINRMAHPMPILVLLDLKLPKVSGLDVLKWIRVQPSLTGLRVIVFSSSARAADRAEATALGADAYVVKQFDSWVPIVAALKATWLDPQGPGE